ncbi:hypothetical protein CVT24_003823 [Panaeolus cyanescens]|uniref:Transmembrane protein n=1 Tax=Panaeolus cyanescens TaxID=181874 RepID=A0A409W830_9AGAR|nr:hypothetical protein CVT24_003823 [Panaeolus cyanescens]
MAQFYHPQSYNRYHPSAPYAQVTPVDPFKPSVAYSVQNVGGGTGRPNRISYDDIPLPPPGSQYIPPRPPGHFGPVPPFHYNPGQYGQPPFHPNTHYPPYNQAIPIPPSPYSWYTQRPQRRPSSSQLNFYIDPIGRERRPSLSSSSGIGGDAAPESIAEPVSEKHAGSPRYSPASVMFPEEVPIPDSPITAASWPIELVDPPKSPVLTTEKRSESTIPQSIMSDTYGKSSAGMLLIAFLVDTLPRQIYLHLLLRLPSLYFSRVSRIFLEAEVTMPEIKQGVLADAQYFKSQGPYPPEPCFVSPCYQKLQNSWEGFIDSLLKEWKTLNIVSVLLLSAILTVLQLEGAADDPVTRFSALISMICGLMSLLFGCMYIIRFGTMRKAYKAAEWAQEAQQTQTGIVWNVWIMLAMPAVWLAWSMISYIICIMAYVWRTGTTADDGREIMSSNAALAPRIVVSCVLCLGLIYFILIASTLRRYGDLMDQAWHRRIQGWVYAQTTGPLGQEPKEQESDPAINFTRFCGLDSGDPEIQGTAYDKEAPHETYLELMRITSTEWRDIHKSLEAVWDPFEHTKLEKTLNRWNKTTFDGRNGQLRLCQEYGVPWSKYAVYFFSRAGRLPYDPECFTSTWNVRLDILGYFKAGEEAQVVCRRLSLFSPVLLIDDQYLRTNDEDWRSMHSLCDVKDTNLVSSSPVHEVHDEDDKRDTAVTRDSKID